MGKLFLLKINNNTCVYVIHDVHLHYQFKTRAKMEIKITTGTYNTSDYRIVKEYKSEKAALKFLKTIGYAYDELSNDTWNYFGTKYKLSIQR